MKQGKISSLNKSGLTRVRGFRLDRALETVRQRGGIASPIVLAGITVVGFSLRWVGKNFGLPYLYHCDEPGSMNAVLWMLKTGDLNPHFFIYPSLSIYLQLVVAVAAYFVGIPRSIVWDLKDIVPTSPDAIAGALGAYVTWTASHPWFWSWARGFVVVLGTFTVVLVYLLGRRVFSQRVGFVAALILAVSPGHVVQSRFVLPNVPTTFLVVLTALLALRVMDRQTYSASLLAGLAAGFTVSSKYDAFLVVLFPVAAVLLAQPWRRGQRLALVFLATMVGFLLGTPYALLALPEFLTGAGYSIYQNTVIGIPGATVSPGLLHLIANVSFLRDSLGVLGLVATGIGLGWAVSKTDTQQRQAALALALPSVVWIGMRSLAKVAFPRNMLPLEPFAAVFAAFGLDAITVSIARRLSEKHVVPRLMLIILLLAVVAQPFRIAASDTSKWHQQEGTDSRIKVYDWLLSLPAGTRIVVMQELDMFKLHLRWLRETGIEVYEPSVLDWSYEYYVEQGYDYIVTAQSFRSSDTKRSEEVARMNEKWRDYEPIVSFGMQSMCLGCLSIDPVIVVLPVKERP